MPELGRILYDWLGLNRALFRLINGMHGALCDRLMTALSTAADAANFPWYMAAVLLLARATPRLVSVQNAFVFGIGSPITSLIVTALKAATALLRPAVALGEETVTLLDRQAGGGAFPSGHVATASLLAAALSAGRRGSSAGSCGFLSSSWRLRASPSAPISPRMRWAGPSSGRALRL